MARPRRAPRPCRCRASPAMVTRISAGGNRAGAVTSDGGCGCGVPGPLGNGGHGRTRRRRCRWRASPTRSSSPWAPSWCMVLRSDGSRRSRGATWVSRTRRARTRCAVCGGARRGRPQAVAAGGGSKLGFLVDANGVAWGFGKLRRRCRLERVHRRWRVRVARASGAGAGCGRGGSVDSQRLVPRPRSGHHADGSGGVDAEDARRGAASPAPIRAWRSSHDQVQERRTYGKRINNYVLGLVPTTFFGLVKTAPSVSSPARSWRRRRRTPAASCWRSSRRRAGRT